MKLSSVVVEDAGKGYAHDLPIAVTIEKPPAPISAAAAAQVTALLSEPTETLIRSWLPSTSVRHPDYSCLSKTQPSKSSSFHTLSWCWINGPWCHIHQPLAPSLPYPCR